LSSPSLNRVKWRNLAPMSAGPVKRAFNNIRTLPREKKTQDRALKDTSNPLACEQVIVEEVILFASAPTSL
jgi:hypothetical protein